MKHSEDYSIRKRLFVVGCPRSGTTLLQCLLAAHPQIASFPESHFLLGTSRTRRGRWMRKLRLVSPEMRIDLTKFLSHVRCPEAKLLFPRHMILLGSFTKQFVILLDRLTLAQGKNIWIEKTPGHLYYIDDLERYIPSAKFIHLIRNGVDVVASLYEVTNQYPNNWGGKYGIDECIHTWNHCIQLSLQHLTKQNHMVIDYEQLIAEPENSLRILCKAIEIPFKDTMLTNYQDVTKDLIIKHEVWKNGAMREISSTSPTKFRLLFTPKQQNYIQSKLAHRTYLA